MTQPLSAAEFLCAMGLLVDVKNCCLGATDFDSLPCAVSSYSTTLSSALITTYKFSCLLGEFPDLTTSTFFMDKTKHGVEHHRSTTGPPFHARGHCFDPAKLTIARADFDNMEQLVIYCQSNSPWTSPMYMVPTACAGRAVITAALTTTPPLTAI